MGKNFLYNLFLSVVNAVFSLFTFKYASLILGPEGIGKVQFSISFAEYFALIAALGIPVYGITVIARSSKEERPKIFTELVLLSFLMSIFIGFIYLLIISFVGRFEQHYELHLIAGILIFGCFTTIDWLYFGLEQFKTIAIRSALIKVLAVCFLFVFVKSSEDYVNYLWFSLIGVLGNNLLSWILIRKQTVLAFKKLELKKHIKPTLFILGSSVAINIYALWDTVLLGLLTDDKTVGIYYAGVKIVKFAVPFIISLGTTLIPKMSRDIHLGQHTNNTLMLSFDFTCLITVPLTACLFILAPEMILLLSGKAFLEAVDLMKILSFLPIIIGLGSIFSIQILIPAGLNRKLFSAAWSAAVFSLTLNFILIPFFGAYGAGTANLVAELISTALLYYFVYQNIKITFNWFSYLKAAAACLPFVPVIFIIRSLNLSLPIFFITVSCGCGVIYLVTQWLIFKNQSLLYVAKKLKLN